MDVALNTMDKDTNLIEIEGFGFLSFHGPSATGRPAAGTDENRIRILLFLMQSDGRVFTRKEIIGAVQGGDYPATDHSVNGHVMSLRRKLGSHGRFDQNGSRGRIPTRRFPSENPLHLEKPIP